MSKRKIVVGLGALALILVAGGITSTASAYKGDPAVKGPNYTAERHIAMEKAFESNDYAAWSKLMANKGRVSKVVNKDNFAQFAKAHELAEKGDTASAAKIRADLGLGLKDGSGQGMRKGAGNDTNRSNCPNR